MYFSDTTNKDGIIQQQEQVLQLGDAGISGNATLLKEMTAKTNNWLHIVTHWIHLVQGEWNYDDQNHGNLNIEAFDFVDEQANYGLTTGGETDCLVLKNVEVRDAITEDYAEITYLEEKDRPVNEFGEDAAVPSYYYLNGGSIIFSPKPDTALADKYRLTYDRNAHIFLSTDTTAVPGFDIKFHPILVYGPAMEYAITLGKPNVYTQCKSMLYGTDAEVDIGFKRMLQEFYSRRLVNQMPRIGRASKSYK